ncbi:MAG: hypothetical protein EBT15_06920 [Betaproteobacteria bacterium]|nr:hypothetical protein [Betaproteobacteria bacterium]
MSWEDLDDPTPPDVRGTAQQREDLAKLCLRVFGTEEGKKLLQWLQDMYVNVPIAVPGTDSSHAYYAEGCRNVVRDIMARINQARNL